MNREHLELKDRLNRRAAMRNEHPPEQMEVEGSILWWAVLIVAGIVAGLAMLGKL